MGKSNIIRAPRQRGKHRGTRPHYRLSEFVMAYALGILVVAVVVSVSPLLTGLSIGVVGVFITRFISRRVVWWNQADNLENVFRAKLHTLFTWPISVPILIFKIAVTQWL